MFITRRAFVGLLGASSLAFPSLAQARTLRILVGYAAGGAADVVARAVAEGLRDAGYTVNVENKAGAAGRLATEALLAAPADGSTLILAPQGNLTLYPHVVKAKFDPLKELTPIAPACRMSFALAVGSKSPATNLQDFLAQAAKTPAMASFGTPGAGTAMHFIGTLLGKHANFPFIHVAYKGGAAAVTDAVGGHLPAVITTTPNLLPMHRSGQLRILAISDDVPNAALPGVPTFKAAGYPDLNISEAFAFFARSGTSPALVAQLNQAIGNAVKLPKVSQVLEKAEFTPLTMSPEAMDKQLQAEHANWARIVKSVGYTPDN